VVVKTRGKVKQGGKRKLVVIGKGTFSAEPGQAGSVNLKLTKPVRKLVRKVKAARKVTVLVKATDEAGNKASAKKQARLTGPGAR